MIERLCRFAAGAACALLLGPGVAAAAPATSASALAKVKHVVVIYEENHSFDNLYGDWEGVNGLGKADYRHTVQVNQYGGVFSCLEQNDLNLVSPPLPATCGDSTTPTTFASAFPNAPFSINSYIPASATTCPPESLFAEDGVLNGLGQPGGCTRDLVHRFYQHQYQIDRGRNDRFVTGSDAVGLTMGTYDTRALPIYRYLHRRNHSRYVVADNFFQGAFGGSFLNHQWLVAAATPVWAGAANDGSANDFHSVVDGNGFPKNYPLYSSPLGTAVKDGMLTESCSPPAGTPAMPSGLLCGDYVVNTAQPSYQPFMPGTADARKAPPFRNPTIGDRLSAAKVSWAWYSGGWSNAAGNVGAPGWTNGTAPAPATPTNPAPCSDPHTNAKATFPYCPAYLFQFHHQPLNYYASFAPGTKARADHLRDEVEFQTLAARSKTQCRIRSVSFIKPLGNENEHPGYASEHAGSTHLVELLRSIANSACARDTMVIVTYDEFGGQWDHVPPPPFGRTRGVSDLHGPGTRIPALVISPLLPQKFAVDSTEHDTTSIVATIEHRWGLKPLSSRDRRVNDLANTLTAS